MALELKGQFEEASQNYSEAYKALMEMGVHSYAINALAGLARCELQAGILEEALLHAEEIWGHLEKNGSSGFEAPILAYITCARAFKMAGDSQSARAVIEKGFTDLCERAARINNPEWETSFVDNFPEHREIARMWQTH
jgi:tetratricopeptide (TPR) repeat protein